MLSPSLEIYRDSNSCLLLAFEARRRKQQVSAVANMPLPAAPGRVGPAQQLRAISLNRILPVAKFESLWPP